MAKFEKNLSEGSVTKQLILFALPILFSNIIQSVYSAADMIIVGNFAENGTVSMSAVNIGSQITLLITNAVFGLTMGATVLIGQYLGANDRRALKETIGTLFTTLIVLAVVVTAVMVLAADPILKLIQTPQNVYSEARIYFVITMMGTIFIFGYNALSAIMRGMGDSKNPLIFVAIAGISNIIGDLYLVKGRGMGAAGAAIATVGAQAISMILCIVYLARNDFVFDFKLSSFGFHGERLRLLLKIGIPSTIQNVAVGSSFLFLTAIVNTIDPIEGIASAAVGVVAKINGFAILPAIAMSSAVSAMAAQNIGANEYGRAKKTMYIGQVIAVIITYTIFVVVKFFPEPLINFFASPDDPNYARLLADGTRYMSAYAYDYLFVPFLFCFNGLFIGAGHTMFTLINTLVASILVRVPVAYFVGLVLMDNDLYGVGLGAAAATLIGMLSGLVYFISGKWQKAVILGGDKRG